MERGTLIVTVNGGNVAVPIEGATVKIFIRKQGAQQENLEQAEEKVKEGQFTLSFITNSDGRTNSVTIDTPDTELSLDENESEQPFSVADVYVEKEGFFGALFFGVQIFPRRESILPVNLEPFTQKLVDMGSVNTDFTAGYAFVYFIPVPEVGTPRGSNLTENAISESENGRFSPFIESEVFIPEFITVHLGNPSAPAEDVTVPFQDYIKNVASSEIYPTWPESAIRANIYAQISIALNRVYTEWYASRGFPFQITNSTAYDQAFVNGRNIYGNIERIVDEIFNTYIRRQGFEEPLFATYCDGRTSTCNGMTQWGSFDLANQGYTPISILKYYYGENIELVSTDNIRGIESTYGGTPLSIGMASEDIAEIQRQLNRIREDYPSIPFIVYTNGFFGSDTDAAVRRFQEVFNLVSDGIVGKATWYRISIVYVSVKRLGELTSEGQSTDFKYADVNTFLEIGSQGDDVATLQYLIEYISIFYRSVQPTSVDGIFGQQTVNALNSFQRTFGLPETGTTTPQTWMALFGVYEAILKVVFPVTAEQTFPGTLQQGDSGESVRLLQRYLNVIAQYYGDIPTLDEDGVFGSRTRNAIYEFQRLYLFEDTGVVDSLTWYRIVELYNYIVRQNTN